MSTLVLYYVYSKEREELINMTNKNDFKVFVFTHTAWDDMDTNRFTRDTKVFDSVGVRVAFKRRVTITDMGWDTSHVVTTIIQDDVGFFA